MKKRILAFVLTVIMVAATMPLWLIAAYATDGNGGDTVELYNNEFDTAMNPNGGTSSSCVREDYSNFADGKGMTVYGGGVWKEPVTLNNATGEVVLTMYIYNNNFTNQKTLSINGVQVCGGDENAHVLIGGVDKSAAAKAWRRATITVTISDLTTGVANVKIVDEYTNTWEGTVTLGAISGKLDLQIGDSTNSFKVDYVKVTQVATAVIEEENITVQGYQQTKVENGTWSVRFVATGKIVEGLEKVGFEIAVNGGTAKDLSTTVVYDALNANYGADTVTAASYEADYITAIAVNGIPSDSGNVEFTVKPYIVVNGAKQYGVVKNATVTPIDSPAFDSDFTLAGGETKKISINTADYASGKIQVKFQFAQNGTTSGGEGFNAALFNIDKKLALRVTGGGATHVINASGATASANWWGYTGSDYPNSKITFIAVIDVANNSVTFQGGWDSDATNVSGTITDFDFSDGVIDLTFGGSAGKDLTIANFAVTEVK